MTLELPEKLNKDPDFAPILHFSQYFKASPGLEIQLLQASSGGWELDTSLQRVIIILILKICLWKRRVTKSGYEIDGREGRGALSRRTVHHKDSCYDNVHGNYHQCQDDQSVTLA